MKIGITGVHASCRRSPGLAVAKALNITREHSMIAIDYDELSTGLYLPLFEGIEIISWTNNEKDILTQIQCIHERYQLDVLLPCLNSDVILFSKIQDRLQKKGIKTLLPSESSLLAREKQNLSYLAEQVSLFYPVTKNCYSMSELDEALDKIGCPCVIKGAECGVFPVRDRELFAYFSNYCQNTFGFPILIQEWMEGEEYSVFALCDVDSTIRLSVTARKNGIADDGETWMSVIVDGTGLEKYVKRFVYCLDWIGPIEFDFIKRDNELFVIDINPRFPSWIDGLADAGLNAPSHTISLIKGKCPTFSNEVPVGTILFKDFDDICFPVNSMIMDQKYGTEHE